MNGTQPPASDDTLTVTAVDLEGDLDGSRRLVREYERRHIAGRVFVQLRVEAQLLGAAATALIPSDPMDIEDFVERARAAYWEARAQTECRIAEEVARHEEALNPPPGIVDVG